jgi:hypothetical protein
MIQFLILKFEETMLKKIILYLKKKMFMNRICALK